METDLNQNQKDIYLDMTKYLDDIGTKDFMATMKQRLRDGGLLDAVNIENCQTPAAVVSKLKERGSIKVWKYNIDLSNLIKLMGTMNANDAMGRIEIFQQKLKEAGKDSSSREAAPVARNVPAGDLPGASQKAVDKDKELERLKEQLRIKEEKILQLAKGSRDVQRCQKLFTKNYQPQHIQSIINLGEWFAVAYCEAAEFTNIAGVDIYDLSGIKQRTLSPSSIKGLRCLASTPDRKGLVAICQEVGDSYTIRSYDPLRGYLTSTPIFRLDYGYVKGLDVRPGGDFVVLHGDPDCYNKISVIGNDGSVIQTNSIRAVTYYISYGGKYLFASLGGLFVDVYEFMEDNRLEHIARQGFDELKDVSATSADEVTVTCRRGDNGWFLGRANFSDKAFSAWKFKDVKSRCYQDCVSVGGDHVVVAARDDQYRRGTLTVFLEGV